MTEKEPALNGALGTRLRDHVVPETGTLSAEMNKKDQLDGCFGDEMWITPRLFLCFRAGWSPHRTLVPLNPRIGTADPGHGYHCPCKQVPKILKLGT
jgi:hypothetical protein